FQATFLVLVRKATTITPRDAVGNWLYGVAYRAAQKIRVAAARRRSKEVQMAQIPEPATVADGLWHDLVPLLDHELALLPAKYRLPLVLCDLEGKTRKEAARQLGWPEGTVAGRLASARKMLAKRLARHGLPVSAGVLAAVLAESGTQAAVPLTLAVATVRAATGGIVQAGVFSVAEGVVRTMFLSNLKLPMLVLVAFTAVAAGAVLGLGRPQPAQRPGGLPETSNAPKVYSGQTPEKATRGQESKPKAVEETAWGEAVDGLQAGLAYADRGKHAYGLGQQVTFVVSLRNVGSRKATVSFWSPPDDNAGPIVVGMDRKPQQAYPEVKGKDGKPAKVIPPPVWHYSPHVIERVLEPGQVIELGRPRLWLVGENSSRRVGRPTLVAAPGSYRVHFSGLAGGMEFATGTGLLTTGAVDLQVTPQTAATAAKEADPHPSDLSGTWQALSFEQDGRQKFAKEAVRKVTARFHNCRYQITPLPWGPEGSFDGTYQIDGDTEPKAFSLYPANGVLKRQAFRGIYRVEGDKLTLCFSWPPLERPTEFRSRPNTTIVLAVFRRAKP
ncbi:MAG TPA: TIGR03067 domain-containing protein, partial [Gemmataceae bacterium]|nr:TIGR03067 domain-containing protein [Gemmataceae bacterium]